MITFYPRDIGLWREDFNFSDRTNRPTQTFKNRDDLSKFVLERYNIENEKYPLTYIEEENIHFGTTHIVHKWTVLGWMKETPDNL